MNNNLFESTNAAVDPPVYDTDQLLLKYTKQNSNGFVTDIQPARFFSNLSSINFTSEIPTAVTNRAIDGKEPVINSRITANTANENATMVEIRATVTHNNIPDPALAQNILNTINNMTSSVSSTSSAVTQNHSTMDDYMRDIVKASCTHYLTRALQFNGSMVLSGSTITSIAGVPNNTLLFEAIDNMRSGLTATRRNILIEAVSSVTRKTLLDILSDPNMNALPVNVLSTFLDNDPLYYKVRSNVINNLVVTSNNSVKTKGASVAVADLPASNEDILLYMKRVIVDMYIKTCYPLVYYDIFNALLKRYADKGDFINVRIALLAKVFYVYNLVDYINTVASSNVTALSAVQKTRFTNIFTNISTNLLNYITRLNNLSVVDASGRNSMKEIIQDLQKLSENVVNQSTNIDTLRNDIASNQLALRNIVSNYASVENIYNTRVNVFWIVVSIMITLIVVCTIFIFFKPSIVYYITGIAITTILIIQLVLAIIRMMK
jgi:hypothetical protein